MISDPALIMRDPLNAYLNTSFVYDVYSGKMQVVVRKRIFVAISFVVRFTMEISDWQDPLHMCEKQNIWREWMLKLVYNWTLHKKNSLFLLNILGYLCNMSVSREVSRLGDANYMNCICLSQWGACLVWSEMSLYICQL